MEPIYEHPIVVRFKAATTTGLPWKFTPCQESIIGKVIDTLKTINLSGIYCSIVYLQKVYPGETALAFYTATNETNEPIIGKNHKCSSKKILISTHLY